MTIKKSMLWEKLIIPSFSYTLNIFRSTLFFNQEDLSYPLRSHAFKDVNEIIRLQKELFDLLHLNIKDGIKKGRIHMDIDGIKREGIRHDIDSFYATSLVLSTIESMLNPPPFLEKELKDRDIDKYQFETILMRFVNRLLMVKD